MNEEEIAYLEKALNNDNNENITNLTFKDVNEKKQIILADLQLSNNELEKMLKKLEDYNILTNYQNYKMEDI